MLGYAAVEVVNKITPAHIHDPQEVIERAQALSRELGTTIAPGFEALAFKTSRGRRLRGDSFVLQERGALEVEGQGDIKTWFVGEPSGAAH